MSCHEHRHNIPLLTGLTQRYNAKHCYACIDPRINVPWRNRRPRWWWVLLRLSLTAARTRRGTASGSCDKSPPGWKFVKVTSLTVTSHSYKFHVWLILQRLSIPDLNNSVEWRDELLQTITTVEWGRSQMDLRKIQIISKPWWDLRPTAGNSPNLIRTKLFRPGVECIPQCHWGRFCRIVRVLPSTWVLWMSKPSSKTWKKHRLPC